MDQHVVRKYVISAIIILVGIIFFFRLLFLQVISSSYKLSAESNSRRMEIVYPARGLIYDRDGRLLVYNVPSYDLKIAPYELEAFDSLQLCDILEIDIQTLRDAIHLRKEKPGERYNAFIKQLPPETFAKLKEILYKFPGFYFSTRPIRAYQRNIAPHLLGYLSEVDSNVIKQNSYYESGDYYGKSGVEKFYENILRGKKGKRYKNIDARGREKGSYKDGKYDEDAEVGKNIRLTIDARLQAYGEMLMQNYEGSIVAIEPETGEILTLVSAPYYKPSVLVGRDWQTNYEKLEGDTLEPLFNNALMALYPPGSTFKTINALVALQEGDVTYNTKYSCHYGFTARGVSVKCHGHPTPLNLPRSIQYSCNAYFCNVFLKIMSDKDFSDVHEAYNNWRAHVQSFGFGSKLGIDLPFEKNGFLPKSDYFDRYYGKKGWKGLTIISMAIGQGEVLTTPLQLANLAAIIANKGYYYTPHVVKSIEGSDSISVNFTTPRFVSIDTSYFAPIIEGMKNAVNGTDGGTARIAKNNDIVICGKTGTAENPHGEDHSVFMAFAPMDDPKIAIAVYVEHGKWGASFAAPIASLMIEKYLTGDIAANRKWVEKRMLDKALLLQNATEN
jgi:penicillin-binding protein 2